MKFTLEIKLGNDAMRTAHDIGSALLKVANDYFVGEDVAAAAGEGETIRDINGNTVGHWEVTE